MMNTQTLYAVAFVDSADNLSWSLSERKNPKKGERKDVDLPKGSGPWKFKIRLENDTGLKLSYNDARPIDVGESCGCPPPEGIHSDQICDVNLKSNDMLEFTDRNDGGPVDLRYQLNFVDGNKQPVDSLDPIIRNGGGGNDGRSHAMIALVVGSALIGLAAAIWFTR